MIEVVDTSIYESVFGILEGVLPDFDGAGSVRGPSGSTVTGIVPTGTYRTKDGKEVVIGANSNRLFKRLVTQMGTLNLSFVSNRNHVLGREDLADDRRFSDNQKRVENERFLDELIGSWACSKTAEELMESLNEAQVPNGLIYDIQDICNGTECHFNHVGV